jgi:hypothetical protein
MTSLTGVNVIQYYQSEFWDPTGWNLGKWMLRPNSSLAILYKGLGIGSHTILALAAVYGTVAFISNSITTKYMTDQWGRRKYVKSFHCSCVDANDPKDAHHRIGRYYLDRNLRRCDAKRIPAHR